MAFIFGFIIESLHSLVFISMIYAVTQQIPERLCLKLFKSYRVGMHKIYQNFTQASSVTIEKEKLHKQQKSLYVTNFERVL